MDIDNRKVLMGVVIITLLLFPAIAFTSGALRIAFGLLLTLFFPGYALLSALFPKQGKLEGIERIALSLGLSIAITAILGLLLNYTPWGIKLYPALTLVTIFILLVSAVAWYRQQRLPPAERLSIVVSTSLPKWSKMGNADKVLSIALVVAILLALGSLGYAIAMPREGERFTEFYILGVDGRAENYPRQLTQGEAAKLIIRIVNHEHEDMSYRVDIKIDGNEVGQVKSKVLPQGEMWEKVVSFTPQNPGKNQKVEFWLYKDNDNEPYFKEPLNLYIDVSEPPL